MNLQVSVLTFSALVWLIPCDGLKPNLYHVGMDATAKDQVCSMAEAVAMIDEANMLNMMEIMEKADKVDEMNTMREVETEIVYLKSRTAFLVDSKQYSFS